MPHNKIEIRSEEVQEILGFIPNWIIRWGITVVFSVILIILIGSWFFKHPKIVDSQVVVTTVNPPATIVARSTGKIERLFVQDNQKVKKGEDLAVIENSANYNEVFDLNMQLQYFRLNNFAMIGKLSGSKSDREFNSISESGSNGHGKISVKDFDFKQYYSLGDLQYSYSSFLKAYSDYKYFIELNYHNRKIKQTKEQVKLTNIYYEKLNVQQNILANEYSLSQKQYTRDSILYNKGIITKRDFEKSELAKLQKEYSLEVAKTALTDTKIQITKLIQSVADLEMEYSKQKNQHEISLKQTYNNLTSGIKQWEQNYLLKTPISGKITFTTYWSVNQNVKEGDKVMTVIPDQKSEIIGKLMFNVKGSGRVKVGQDVNIKFTGYPYMEYGMVKGKIETVSLVPSNNFYVAEISLPNGLRTNYGRVIDFGQEMQGEAEIITEDIRLLERFINPIKTIIKRQSD